MLQEIKIKYFNEALQIAVINWREVHLLKSKIIKLNVEVDEGRLIYRAPGSTKRISYRTLKKDVKKKSFSILEEVLFICSVSSLRCYCAMSGTGWKLIEDIYFFIR